MADNGRSLAPTIVAWFLGAVTVVVVALASMAYNGLNDKIDKLNTNVEALNKAVNESLVERALNTRDIEDIKDDLSKHIERTGP